jgi:hypothetical protein
MPMIRLINLQHGTAVLAQETCAGGHIPKEFIESYSNVQRVRLLYLYRQRLFENYLIGRNLRILDLTHRATTVFFVVNSHHYEPSQNSNR